MKTRLIVTALLLAGLLCACDKNDGIAASKAGRCSACNLAAK